MEMPTAKSLGISHYPCDICKTTDQPVSFWGRTSVLICGKDECRAENWRRWDEHCKAIEEEERQKREWYQDQHPVYPDEDNDY